MLTNLARGRRRAVVVATTAVLAVAAAVVPLVLTRSADASSADYVFGNVSMTLRYGSDRPCDATDFGSVEVDETRQLNPGGASCGAGVASGHVIVSTTYAGYGLAECDGVDDFGLPVEITVQVTYPGSGFPEATTHACATSHRVEPTPVSLHAGNDTAEGWFEVTVRAKEWGR